MLSAGIFVLMAALTSAGMLHASSIAFEYDATAHHVGAPAGTTNTWKIILMYVLSAVLMGLLAIGQKLKKVPPPEEEDYRVLQKAIAESTGAEPEPKSSVAEA